MATMARLADLVSREPAFKQAQPAYVSVYRRHQCYGGPEEGGWWYDRIELEGSVPFPAQEQAEAWLEQAKAAVEALNRTELTDRCLKMESLPDEDLEPLPANCSEGYIPTGWDDGGEVFVCVEVHQGERDNMAEPRPHYE